MNTYCAKQVSILMTFLFLLFTISAFSQPSQIGDNNQNSLDWGGSYYGILIDKKGNERKTEIQLDYNGHLLFYQSTNNAHVLKSNIPFRWDRYGRSIHIKINRKKYVFWVKEGSLQLTKASGYDIDKNKPSELYQYHGEITGKYWKLIEANGQPVTVFDKEPYFILNEDNTFKGFAGCNNFNGEYKQTNQNEIHFSNIINTKKACPALQTETNWIQMLHQTQSYTFIHDLLLLLDKNGKIIARLEAVYF